MTENSNSSAEAVYGCFVNLGANILGFIVFAILLATVNPFILVITSSTALLGLFARKRAFKWRHDHDDEYAAFGDRLWYINKIGPNFTMAKDIRLFSMIDWLSDIYNANIKLLYDFFRKLQYQFVLADLLNCIGLFIQEGISYAYLLYRVLEYDLPTEDFVLLFATISGFSGWVTGILHSYSELHYHSLNYDRLREFQEYEDSFTRERGTPLTYEAGKKYQIELRNVSFKYIGQVKQL